MQARTEYEAWHARIAALAGDDGPAERGGAQTARTFASEVHGSALSHVEKSALMFMCSSIVINAGFDLGEPDLLMAGKELAVTAEALAPQDEPLRYQCRYNVANAMIGICDLGLPSGGARDVWEPRLIQNRMDHRGELVAIRRIFFEVGSSPLADPHTRSASYCNLANMLDHSGRWAEAYDYYLRALETDPTNGNAAGNLAQLLRSRITSGVGQTAHIAAVYDMYVTLAQQLRSGTLDFASNEVAERWDALEQTGSQGHLSHGLGDREAPDYEYRRWVAQHRLALSPAVEGLGSDGLRWDSATVETLYSEGPDIASPPILAAMNVLKSDFLVSRRLAFEGVVQVREGPGQAAEDSGSYTETLDYSLYGTQYSKLLLAQRSALDVLDKTAVVVNDHFKVGEIPSKIKFRSFWTAPGAELREALVRGPGRSLPNLALAELAMDMDTAGIYAASQALRNAGTHRIVHAALDSATGVTREARSSIHIGELLNSTVLALQVTRSAFLYLIDLVAMWNHPDDHPGLYLPLPELTYLHDHHAEDSPDHKPDDVGEDATRR